MIRLDKILSVFIFLGSLVAQATEKLAVLDLSGQRDEPTLAADQMVLEQLKKLLCEKSGAVPVEVASKFLEPPDPVWKQLENLARESLEKANQFFYALKPAAAIEELNKALGALRSAFPDMEDFSLLLQVHLMLGVNYFIIGEKALAEQQFRQALLLDPGMVLDEARFNPRLVEAFEKLRHALQTEKRGSLSVSSQPERASVTIDGKYSGITPLTLTGLVAGEHYLKVSLEGYRTWFSVVKLASGGTLQQDITLQAGESMKLVRHLKNLEGSTLSGADTEDIKPLMDALGVDFLIMAAIRRSGGDTRLQLSAARAADARPVPLGIFGVLHKDLQQAAQVFASWIRGEFPPPHLELQSSSGANTASAVTSGPPVPPAQRKTTWLGSWWFWTVVGIVTAGTAATVTFLALEKPSGYRIEVIR